MKSRVYSATYQNFRKDILHDELYNDLMASFPTVVGFKALESEVNSWKESLPQLAAALRIASIPDDVQIILEQKIPHYAKRIDATLLGHDTQGVPHVVIVELKAWTEARLDDDGNVLTKFRGRLVSTPHPSHQVRGYHDHLMDFSRCFHGHKPLNLSSCAYCHNYNANAASDGLFHPHFDYVRSISPIFGRDQLNDFADFLQKRLIGGNGFAIQVLMDEAGIGPSKSLIEHADKMIQRQAVFHLLDEQLAANNAIISAFNDAIKNKQKRVLVIGGGPGTGKSVIALNAVGEALKQGLDVSLVTGSAAFTYGLRKVLGRRLDGLVRFTDFFWNAPADSKDVLVVDEGHRIRKKSVPRVRGELRPTISQAEELIRAAKVTVVFTDQNQIIAPDEVGGPAVFHEACIKLGVRIQEYHLQNQFRCSGSDAYLLWLDDLLELVPDPQGLKLKTPKAFNVKLIDSPHLLLREIIERNNNKPNSARLVSGWCWPWSDSTPQGLVEDIVIGDFRFPWEAKNAKKGRIPPKGIPEAKYWAVDPAGAGQAGTVYSMQGFEMQHVGVIIGEDLTIRNGRWVAQPAMNYSNGLRGQEPAIALPFIKRIYRTLLSRAVNSCSIYCVDAETRTYIADRLIN